ncbi:MAG: hypothetical protein ABMA64_40520, partial [Myxococcota bacterium]
DGELRWIGSTLTDFPVDAEGTSIEQPAWLDQRIRVTGIVRPDPAVALTTQWDLLTGQLAGATWAIPGEIDAQRRYEHGALALSGVRPRKASIGGTTRGWQLEAGLVTSNWGLGMVANDGATDPLFGRADFGDRVVRVRATHLPAELRATGRGVFVSAAADWVVDDDTASLRDDQLAFQGVFSALAVDRDRKLGTYFTARQQWEADRSRVTQAGVLDGYATAPLSVGEGELELSAEAAAILGRTSRSTTYGARDFVGVESLGATGVATWKPAEPPLELTLRAGFASGDGNPDDAITHDFAFDRDFGVGMVLFDQVTGAVEAAAFQLLSDPTYAGQPPDGVDAIVTEGAFRRAAFVSPVARWAPRPFEARAGIVASFATGPFAEPFYSYRAGGTPYNQHDLPAEGRLLGTELDWALAWDSPSDHTLRAGVELEGGHLLLGAPLRGAGPNVVHLVTATGRVQW